MPGQEASSGSPYETGTSTVSGVVYGAGVERDLGNGWSTRGEYRVYDFGDTDMIIISAPYTPRSVVDLGYSAITVAIIKHF